MKNKAALVRVSVALVRYYAMMSKNVLNRKKKVACKTKRKQF